MYGPLSCGSWPDVKISKQVPVSVLLAQKIVLSYNVCKHARFILEDKVSDSEKPLLIQIRAHHETCNARIKHYNIVGQRFRHIVTLHSQAFHAVACLVALSLRHHQSLNQLASAKHIVKICVNYMCVFFESLYSSRMQLWWTVMYRLTLCMAGSCYVCHRLCS